MNPAPRLFCASLLAFVLSASVCLAQGRGGGGGGRGGGGGGRGGGGGGGASETERGLKILNGDVVRVVYPFDLAMAGTDATFEISYVVDKEGRPTSIKVDKTSNKDAAAAVVAALDETLYETAKKDGKADGETVVSERQNLKATIRQVLSPGDLEFIEMVKSSGAAFVNQREIDGGLRPLGTLAQPMFPSTLSKSKVNEGRAVIEFFIDEDGTVRLPKVISASDPAFGWSAASAVLTWRFAPPTKGGNPVTVKVTGLPAFEIKRPPEASAKK